MPLTQLRQYVLANRQDEEAWAEYASRPRPNKILIPADATEEYVYSVLKQFVSEGKN